MFETNLSKRVLSRVRQLLFSSDRFDFSDDCCGPRPLSRRSSPCSVAGRDFSRQDPLDTVSSERCCDGRSVPVRGLF